MIIAITDKIANFVKKILDRVYQTVKETFQGITFIVTTIGTLLLMVYTIIQPNLFTLILSIILFIWAQKKENYIITILGAFLIPIITLCYLKS